VQSKTPVLILLPTHQRARIDSVFRRLVHILDSSGRGVPLTRRCPYHPDGSIPPDFSVPDDTARDLLNSGSQRKYQNNTGIKQFQEQIKAANAKPETTPQEHGSFSQDIYFHLDIDAAWIIKGQWRERVEQLLRKLWDENIERRKHGNVVIVISLRASDTGADPADRQMERFWWKLKYPGLGRWQQQPRLVTFAKSLDNNLNPVLRYFGTVLFDEIWNDGDKTIKDYFDETFVTSDSLTQGEFRTKVFYDKEQRVMERVSMSLKELYREYCDQDLLRSSQFGKKKHE